MKTKPKYKIGDLVYYLPKLSGFDNKKALKIENLYFQDHDTLYDSLGVKFTPTWCYGFEETCLGAVELDLVITKNHLGK